MSKRRYKLSVTDIDALEAEYPKAVETVTIPARTEKKAVYAIIAKMLDCDIAVPGIEVVSDEEEADGEAHDFDLKKKHA